MRIIVSVVFLAMVPARLAAQEELHPVDASALVAWTSSAPLVVSSDVQVDGREAEHLIPIAPVVEHVTRTGDWQAALAVVLGLVVWILRRFAAPSHLFHSPLGGLILTCASAAIGALVPVLEAHQFSGTSLLGALLSGATAALALSNPSMAAAAGAEPPRAGGSLPPTAVLVLAACGFAWAGCAAFYRQPVALQKAEASALQCGVEAVQQEMAALSPAVLDALAGDSPDWRAQLGHLKVTGANALICAVAHTLFDAIGNPRSLHEGGAVAQRDLEAAVARRLALADAADAVPVPSPVQRVLARGLAFLREHRAAQPAQSSKAEP